MTSSVWDNDSESGGVVVPDSEVEGLAALTDVGDGESIIHSIDSLNRIAYLKTLTAGDNVTILDTGTELEISATIPETYTVDGAAAPFNYVASVGQTDFYYPDTITANIDSTHIWVNGLKLTRLEDYSISPDLFKVVLTEPCIGGESVELTIAGTFIITAIDLPDNVIVWG